MGASDERGAGKTAESTAVAISKLWIPVGIFLFFLLSIFSREELLDRFLGNASTIVRQVFEYGTQIGLWLSAAFLVQRLITVFVWDGLISGISGRPIPRLPKDFTAIIVFSIAGIGVLSTVFGQSVTGIWATSGVFGIVVGIALRNVILDVFIGLSMHVEQPFRIGDWVMVHQNRRETHIVGQVIEINWRTTRLKTTAKNMVVVPNSKRGEVILTNYMQPKPHFRIDLEFVLDYSIPAERAIRILSAGVKALIDDHRILAEPEPEVRLDHALADGQRYEVRYFILPVNITPKESRHLVNRSVIDHLARAGFTPSTKKQRIFVDQASNLPLLAEREGENFDRVVEQSDLFGILDEHGRAKLAETVGFRKLRTGEVLYRQGNQGDRMFLLLEGLLSSIYTLSGYEGSAKVEQIESGRHFGEECVLGKNPRSSTVTAVTDCVLIEIEKEVVRQLAQSNGKLLSFLNMEMNLGQEKILQSKWGIKKRHSEQKPKSKKENVSRSIQTFLTDLFPSSSNKET